MLLNCIILTDSFYIWSERITTTTTTTMKKKKNPVMNWTQWRQPQAINLSLIIRYIRFSFSIHFTLLSGLSSTTPLVCSLTLFNLNFEYITDYIWTHIYIDYLTDLYTIFTCEDWIYIYLCVYCSVYVMYLRQTNETYTREEEHMCHLFLFFFLLLFTCKLRHNGNLLKNKYLLALHFYHSIESTTTYS